MSEPVLVIPPATAEQMTELRRAMAEHRPELQAAPDPRDAEIARLRAQLANADAECNRWMEVLGQTKAEKDAEIARLRAAFLAAIREDSRCAGSGEPPCPEGKACGCREEMQARLDAATQGSPGSTPGRPGEPRFNAGPSG